VERQPQPRAKKLAHCALLHQIRLNWQAQRPRIDFAASVGNIRSESTRLLAERAGSAAGSGNKAASPRPSRKQLASRKPASPALVPEPPAAAPSTRTRKRLREPDSPSKTESVESQSSTSNANAKSRYRLRSSFPTFYFRIMHSIARDPVVPSVCASDSTFDCDLVPIW
jgi:hypothetical protein